MNLRDSARGQLCTVRVPMYCVSNPETTVLAHYRMAGLSGAGLKPPDFAAAFACHICHDLIDGRTHCKEWTRDDLHLMHLRGVLRTQAYWHSAGFIVIGRAA
ncbi:MAG: DUF1364 domain-containing protein [Terriglobales bacterium]